VDLDERRPVIAAAQTAYEIGGQVFGADKFDQRVIRRQIGNDHRSTDFGPVAQTHARDAVALDENPLHLGAIPDLAPI
jgi:hypothetical protein